jgi:LemA protein
MKYNIRLQVFPARLIAQWFGFKPKEYFEIEEAAAREPVRVSF